MEDCVRKVGRGLKIQVRVRSFVGQFIQVAKGSHWRGFQKENAKYNLYIRKITWNCCVFYDLVGRQELAERLIRKVSKYHN